MNILFFYRVYPNYGGVEVVTSVLAKRFVEDGHQVTIASLEQPHPEFERPKYRRCGANSFASSCFGKR